MEKSDLEIQFHEAVASTLRAMAGGTEHEVVFVGDTTFIGNDKIRLPKINDISKLFLTDRYCFRITISLSILNL